MSVRAYSLFTQKNVLQNPSLQGTGSFDGAAGIQGLDVIESMGIETLSSDIPNLFPAFHGIKSQVLSAQLLTLL